MASSPPPAAPKPSRLESAALVLGTGPLLLLLVAWLLFDWRHTLAILAGLAIYVLLVVGLARLTRLPLRDAPPSLQHYLIAAGAGALAGLAYALVLTGGLRAQSLLVGAVSGAGWVWVGSLVRAPFGARAWPPYRDVPPLRGSARPGDRREQAA